ncbi:MAG: Methyltransferase type 11 [Fibrobacteres bacterium]|nr:Methyltransferase type 11 [Fibrobacterota bacterium]
MRDETSYRTIAPYYDYIMAHVDYDAWGRYLARLWKKHGMDPVGILELGAGTCPFARRDVFPPKARVVYSDLSPFMLTQAPVLTPDCRVAANALSLPFKGPFDLCLMVYDAINYLMQEEDVSLCFKESLRVLAPGGLFIFDVTTEANSKKHFHHAVDYGEMEGCTYFRESHFDREARLQGNDFVFFVEGREGNWRKVKESHQQRIYKIDRLKALAKKAGYKVEGLFEGFTFRPGKEGSERVHFVLRKPA